MHDPSLSQSLPRGLCFLGTLSPHGARSSAPDRSSDDLCEVHCPYLFQKQPNLCGYPLLISFRRKVDPARPSCNRRRGTVQLAQRFRIDSAADNSGNCQHAEQIKKHATSVLNRAANAAKQAGVSCDTIQVENEQPYQAIIAAAKNKGCDLIVMASHGRSGLSGVLIGSVTNKVLTHTKTPVLVCH